MNIIREFQIPIDCIIPMLYVYLTPSVNMCVCVCYYIELLIFNSFHICAFDCKITPTVESFYVYAEVDVCYKKKHKDFKFQGAKYSHLIKY